MPSVTRWSIIAVAAAGLLAFPVAQAVDREATMAIEENPAPSGALSQALEARPEGPAMGAADGEEEAADSEEGAKEEIALPEEASETAVENAAFGIETANRAREEARESGREFGQDVRTRAQEMRQDQADVRRSSRQDLPEPAQRGRP